MGTSASKRKKLTDPELISFASNIDKNLARQGKHLAEVSVRDGRIYAVARTKIRTRGQQAGFVFWILRPENYQLDLLSADQDWSLRYGDIFPGKGDEADHRTMRADPDRVEDSDIYLMHALANVGIDDDHIWNAIQRSHEDDVAYFTVAGSCDLSGSNPPGWAPGFYRVDLYIREIGEAVNMDNDVKWEVNQNKNKLDRQKMNKKHLESHGIPVLTPLKQDWFMYGSHKITSSIIFEVVPAKNRNAVQVHDVTRQQRPSTFVMVDESTGNETQIFESTVAAEGLDLGPQVNRFAINTKYNLANRGIHQHSIGRMDGCVHAVAHTGIRTRRQQAGFVFWIENPSKEQLEKLSRDQDWSDRYGSFALPHEDANAHSDHFETQNNNQPLNGAPKRQCTIKRTEKEGGDVLLSQFILDLGVDDPQQWNSLRSSPEIACVAEFTLSSNLDLSDTNPPGWAPGRYRVDLYVCELGETVPTARTPMKVPLNPVGVGPKASRPKQKSAEAHDFTPVRALKSRLEANERYGTPGTEKKNGMSRNEAYDTPNKNRINSYATKDRYTPVRSPRHQKSQSSFEKRPTSHKVVVEQWYDEYTDTFHHREAQGSTYDSPPVFHTETSLQSTMDEDYLDSSRPWQTSENTSRVTEMNQSIQQLYTLDDDQWFLRGNHPITRSIWFTVPAVPTALKEHETVLKSILD